MPKIFIILILLLFILSSAFSQIQQLYPKRFQNGKYGYIDNSSSIIIKPNFDKAFSFNGNLAKVIQDGKWGLVDKNGDYLVKPKYDYIGWSDDGYYKLNRNHLELSNNLLPKGEIFQYNENHFYAYLLNGKWGLIRPNGKDLKNDWDSIYYGIKDLFPVNLKNNGWSWVDGSGQNPKSQFYEDVKTLSNDLIAVRRDSESKYSLSNKEGQILSDKTFSSVANFDYDLIKVGNAGLWGIVDRNANVKYEVIYEDIKYDKWNKTIQLMSFSPWIEIKELNGREDSIDFKPLHFINENLLLFEKDEKRFLKNLEKESISEFPSEIDTLINDGLFLKAYSKATKGFKLYDQELKPVSDLEIEKIDVLDSGIFLFLKESNRDKWLLFDHRNESILLQNIEGYEILAKNKAIIRIGKLSGVYDLKARKWQIENQFNKLKQISDTCFIASQNEKLVIHVGDTAVEFHNKIDEMRPINDSLFAIKNNGRWTLRNFDFRNILNQDFDNICPSELNLIRLKKASKWGLYSLKNQTLVLSFIYDTIGPLKSNLRVVKKGKAYGITNELGYFTYQLREYYSFIDQFDQVWANATFNGLAAKIDAMGNFKISSQYETIGPNIKDHFTFQFRSKWGLLDKREKIVIQPLYDSLFILNENFVKVWKNGKCGIKDLNDKNLIEIEFDRIVINEYGYFYVFKGQSMGLFDAAPRQIRPPTYDKIIHFEKDRIGLKKNGFWQLIDSGGKLVLDKKYSHVLYNKKSNTLYLKEQKPWEVVKLN